MLEKREILKTSEKFSIDVYLRSFWFNNLAKLFHDKGPYHIEIRFAEQINQLVGTSAMKEVSRYTTKAVVQRLVFQNSKKVV